MSKDFFPFANSADTDEMSSNAAALAKVKG